MALTKTSFGNNIPGYLGGDKGRPGVVVLQEWWGITDAVKEQAEIVAKRGKYRVLVPDLYKYAYKLMDNLDWPNAVKEIKEAVDHLRSEGSPKVGSVGFCMGGALAFLAAEHGGADAAVGFYGTPDARLGKPENIKVPVQAHSGSEDAFKGFADPDTVKSWIARVPGNKGSFYEYPGEGHGFMNGSDEMVKIMKENKFPVGSKESQEKAWERVFEFLKSNLG